MEQVNSTGSAGIGHHRQLEEEGIVYKSGRFDGMQLGAYPQSSEEKSFISIPHLCAVNTASMANGKFPLQPQGKRHPAVSLQLSHIIGSGGIGASVALYVSALLPYSQM